MKDAYSVGFGSPSLGTLSPFGICRRLRHQLGCVVRTPTLTRYLALPIRRIIGNLSDMRPAARMLELNPNDRSAAALGGDEEDAP